MLQMHNVRVIAIETTSLNNFIDALRLNYHSLSHF